MGLRDIELVKRVVRSLVWFPVTIKYPQKKPEISSKFRGKLNVDIGCIRCGLCIKYCPADAITMGARSVSVDMGKCNFCGLCTTVCPRFILSFTPEFENAVRASEKEKLVARSIVDLKTEEINGRKTEQAEIGKK
ncbi:MAG: 4Fe-4S binding protein [Candidatus Micrarchaeota archaeon]